MTKRKEVKVKNNPGITKLVVWNDKTAKWCDSGKFRSTRRVRLEGVSRREHGIFENFEDAKAFRLGTLNKADTGSHHKNAVVLEDNRLRFSALLNAWREFHYMTVEASSKQVYEDHLALVENFLGDYPVEEITPELVDEMIKRWKLDHGLRVEKKLDNKQRQSFKRQLDVLKLVLHFYRKRHDARYIVPIYREHYRAARLVVKADHGVRSLKAGDLRRFLAALKAQKNPAYFQIALIQFCLSLRVCEALGIFWEDVDFQRGEITIQRSIVWDRDTWAPSIKERPKNGKARVLAIPEVLMDHLAEMQRSPGRRSGLVFHSGGVPLIRKSVGNAYNRALRLCEIAYVSGTHVIRKTSGTQANAMTGDFHAVSENLGHSNVEETQTYVESLSESKRTVARALNDAAIEALK